MVLELSGTRSEAAAAFSAETVAVASLLHEKIKSQFDRLPTVPWSDTFPYRTRNGMSQIIAYLKTEPFIRLLFR